MDIWHAAAPKIDVLGPDLYLPDFKRHMRELYAGRQPALSFPKPALPFRIWFWAIGQHATLGFSPFGIEDVSEAHPLAKAYKVLRA